MAVSRLPERSTQSPTRRVSSMVNGGSTRTASVAPEMSVVDIGDHSCGSPVGSVPVVGICGDTNTSYDNAASDLALGNSDPCARKAMLAVPSNEQVAAIAAAFRMSGRFQLDSMITPSGVGLEGFATTGRT